MRDRSQTPTEITTVYRRRLHPTQVDGASENAHYQKQSAPTATDNAQTDEGYPPSCASDSKHGCPRPTLLSPRRRPHEHRRTWCDRSHARRRAARGAPRARLPTDEHHRHRTRPAMEPHARPASARRPHAAPSHNRPRNPPPAACILSATSSPPAATSCDRPSSLGCADENPSSRPTTRAWLATTSSNQPEAAGSASATKHSSTCSPTSTAPDHTASNGRYAARAQPTPTDHPDNSRCHAVLGGHCHRVLAATAKPCSLYCHRGDVPQWATVDSAGLTTRMGWWERSSPNRDPSEPRATIGG